MASTTNEDENAIMQSLEGVRRLENDKFDLYQNTPRKKHTVIPHQNLSHPVDDFVQVSHNIPSAIADTWFHHGINKKLRRKIKLGLLNIDAMLDLHGHRKHEATQELESFFRYAIASNSRLLLIIHGKGFNSQSEAVLRPLVQHWLSEQNKVLAYCPAQLKDGGAGASYVYLKSAE